MAEEARICDGLNVCCELGEPIPRSTYNDQHDSPSLNQSLSFCQPHNFFYCLIVGSKPLRIEIFPIAVVKWCKIYEICHTRLQSIKGRLIEYNLNVVYHTYTTICFA